MVEPTQADELLETGQRRPHLVAPRRLHAAEGILHGTLEVLVNVRVSDFLRQQPGLAVLHDCSLVPYGQPATVQPGPPAAERAGEPARVTGVAEWVNQQV